MERQDSAMMAFLAQADALVIRPPHAPAAKAGAPVKILRFHKDLKGL
jgi:molybdopterin molybdotransferase